MRRMVGGLLVGAALVFAACSGAPSSAGTVSGAPGAPCPHRRMRRHPLLWRAQPVPVRVVPSEPAPGGTVPGLKVANAPGAISEGYWELSGPV